MALLWPLVVNYQMIVSLLMHGILSRAGVDGTTLLFLRDVSNAFYADADPPRSFRSNFGIQNVRFFCNIASGPRLAHTHTLIFA